MSSKKRNPPTKGYWFVSQDGDEVYEIRMPKLFYSNYGLSKRDPMYHFNNELSAIREARIRASRRISFLTELRKAMLKKLESRPKKTIDENIDENIAKEEKTT